MAVARPAVAFLVLCTLVVCHALPKFADELPNLPVVAGKQVRGVGHIDPSGKGDLNSFGKDFAKVGYTWTTALCRMDSDGDGVSNGRELGDPNCTWKKGMARPASSTPITHPGDRSSKP